jgi:hypothetical protein
MTLDFTVKKSAQEVLEYILSMVYSFMQLEAKFAL